MLPLVEGDVHFTVLQTRFPLQEVYRKWTPTCWRKGSQVEQLVLSSCCRRTVLELGHQIPLSGHLGKEKTLKRILRTLFWPSIFKDIEDFCRSCVQCQKSSGRKVPPAPFIPLPVISEPFSRIVMDIIGPLPRSKSGNKYILVLCDYATCYPEAVPLRSIDAEHIAEKLVGMPWEI